VSREVILSRLSETAGAYLGGREAPADIDGRIGGLGLHQFTADL